MSTPIAILRRPDGLYGLVCRRSAPFEPPSPENGDARAPGAAWTPYVYRLVPLAELPKAMLPARERLLEAWHDLARIRAVGPELRARLSLLLRETIADPCFQGSGHKSPELPHPLSPPPRTAAHPRGYRGTPHRTVRRSPRRPRVDLRPSLASPAAIDRLLPQLGVVDEPLRARLRWRRRLPPAFRRELGWSLRGLSERIAERALGPWWALDLERRPLLRRAVALLFARAPIDTAIAWCRVTARSPWPRQVVLPELILESAAWQKPPTPAVIRALEAADQLASPHTYRHRAFQVLSADAPAQDWLVEGFQLANLFEPGHRFEHPPTDHPTPSGEEVLEVAIRLERCEEKRLQGGFPLTVWRTCSTSREAALALTRPLWNGLDPAAALELTELLIYTSDRHPTCRATLWTLVRRILDDLSPLSPADRSHAISALWGALDRESSPDRMASVVDASLYLSARLAALPGRHRRWAYWTLLPLAALPRSLVGTVCNAPRRTLHRLERATRRDNDARRVRHGLTWLARELPGLTARAFVDLPDRLFRIAKTLSDLPLHARSALGAQVRRHPIITCDPDRAALDDLADLLERHGPPAAARHLPRRLRQHRRGEELLRPTQCERILHELRRRWLEVELDTLGAMGRQTLAASLESAPADERIFHAIRLRRSLSESRRALGRVIRAYLQGDPAYASRHPKNLAWLAAHPQISARVWTKGFRQRVQVKRSTLVLCVERDPLEALRLGTYVGSCLGLGGVYEASAATIVLDVNKQVVYARNSSGKVLGRQVLAISENDQLVLYPVYPWASAVELGPAFAQFARSFAQALGIEIYDPTDSSSPSIQVAEIVGRDWYDDGALSLTQVETGEEVATGELGPDAA